MPELLDGQTVQVQGSAARPYVLKNIGGVYSCSCPAWRNQSLPIDRRTCKHLKSYLGDATEAARVCDQPTTSPTVCTTSAVAPPLLLAESWDTVADPSGWMLSEKLDGVRAYWDSGKFLSRAGHPFHAPDWFTAGLPPVPLDGELWIGRKHFQQTVSIVRRQAAGELWRQVRYRVFDAPAVPEPFERRLNRIADMLAEHRPDFALLHHHIRCRNETHLREELGRVLALGGEGIMLRQPGSRYAAGRSATLLKVKQFLETEARVIGHQPGTGRHRGRLGALRAVLPSGVEFAVGTGISDAQRDHPPPVGSTITFRYQELTDGGVPRFPAFIAVRDEEPNPSTPDSPKGSRTMPTPRSKTLPADSATATATATASVSTRRFEFVRGSSDKFYEVSVRDNLVTVRYGRNGTQGQTQTKTFPDAARAQQHASSLIAAKAGKGYVEVP